VLRVRSLVFLFGHLRGCPSLQVTGYYDLLTEFGIQAPAEDLAAAACLDADYASLRDTTWAAEAAKERYAEAFRAQLEQQAAELAKEVARLRVEGEQEVFLMESQGALGRCITSAASAEPCWAVPCKLAPDTAGCSTAWHQCRGCVCSLLLHPGHLSMYHRR